MQALLGLLTAQARVAMCNGSSRLENLGMKAVLPAPTLSSCPSKLPLALPAPASISVPEPASMIAEEAVVAKASRQQATAVVANSSKQQATAVADVATPESEVSPLSDGVSEPKQPEAEQAELSPKGLLSAAEALRQDMVLARTEKKEDRPAASTRSPGSERPRNRMPSLRPKQAGSPTKLQPRSH